MMGEKGLLAIEEAARFHPIPRLGYRHAYCSRTRRGRTIILSSYSSYDSREDIITCITVNQLVFWEPSKTISFTTGVLGLLGSLTIYEP